MFCYELNRMMPLDAEGFAILNLGKVSIELLDFETWCGVVSTKLVC